MKDPEDSSTETAPITNFQGSNTSNCHHQKLNESNNTDKMNKNLPVVLLSNIQSFGRSVKNDKTVEVELTLNHNNVDIAVFTETWLCHDTSNQLPFNDYVKFHLIRENVERYSGGVSIFIHKNIPATKLDVKVPEHLEVLWVTVKPK